MRNHTRGKGRTYLPAYPSTGMFGCIFTTSRTGCGGAKGRRPASFPGAQNPLRFPSLRPSKITSESEFLVHILNIVHELILRCEEGNKIRIRVLGSYHILAVWVIPTLDLRLRTPEGHFDVINVDFEPPPSLGTRSSGASSRSCST